MDRLGILRLNNRNYSTWKFQIQQLLVRESLWRYVDPGIQPVAREATEAQAGNEVEVQAWKDCDQRAKATIGLFIEPNQINIIRNATTAKQAWELLRNHHEKSSLESQVSLLTGVIDKKFEVGEDIDEHLFKMEDMFNKLTLSGVELPSRLQVILVLRSLPASFNTLTTALECRKDEELTLELVKGKIVDEISKRGCSKGPESVLKTNEKQKKIIVCHHCQKPGHKKKFCKLLQKQEAQEGGRLEARPKPAGRAKIVTESSEAYLFAASTGSEKSSSWTIDSGASSHMSANRDHFQELEKPDEDAPSCVVLADGKKLAVHGIGSCHINCLGPEDTVNQMILTKVLFIPELAANLISVGKICKAGGKVIFDDAGCTINSHGKAIAVAPLVNGLYHLKIIENVQAVAEKHHNSQCLHEWHRKLGHRDPEAIHNLERRDLALGIKIQDCGIRVQCECCIQGKMARVPFPKKAKKQSENILDLIHTDICGPMQTVTPGGNRYFLTVIDDFSRYSWVYLLQMKSEAVDCIKNFVQLMKTSVGKVPKIIRSDQGGEYCCKELERFCLENGIQQQFTTAYSPQQNGIAERKNRSLVEMARCMLIDAGMHKRYWAEAINTANYIQNILPSRAIEKTPFEIWKGIKPDVTNLHVFGTQAYVFVPKEKRGKFEEKAEKMTFVGYSSQHKGFRFVNLKTNKVIISRDVRFLDSDQREIDQYEDSMVEYPLSQETAAENEYRDETPEETGSIEDNTSELSESEYESATASENDEPDEDQQVVRRSSRNTKGIPPARYGEMSALVQQDDDEPQNFAEAMTGPEREQWKIAVEEELQSLMSNCTWQQTTLPPGKKAVGCKWIFRKKTDERGNVVRFKARLVAQGFTQVYGSDFDEVYAPVAKQQTFRVLLTVAAREKMLVKHVDVKTAYLHGDLDETIYMRLPPGVRPVEENAVCLLKKSLYGLKQSARMWNIKIDGVLKRMGFRQAESDPCLYIRKQGGKSAFVLIYVDDMLVVCQEEREYKYIMKTLGDQFDLTELGDVKHYLGIQIERTNDGFYLNQGAYIRKMANRFGLENAKKSNIPMDPGYIQNQEEREPMSSKEQFQSLVGGLLYVAVHSRPDISISSSILGRQVSKPTVADWTEAKRVLRYLVGTNDYALKLDGTNEGLEGFADADWAGNVTDRKSNSGYLFRYGGGLVSWCARKQQCVALSSTEAEYVSLSECCQELLWLEKLLKDLGEEVEEPITIFEDNQSCIKQLKQEGVTKRSKHIDTKFHFVKDLAASGRVAVHYCPSEEMLADILTKPLSRLKLENLREQIGLRKRVEGE